MAGDEANYDFDKDRDLNVLTVSDINDRILPCIPALAGSSCTEVRWLSNPEGAFWVNRVYQLKLVRSGDGGEELLVLKVAHPLWNGAGKSGNEARALRFLEQRFPDLPAPRVLGYHSPRDERIASLSSELRAEERQRWLLGRSIEERQRDTVLNCEWVLMSFVEGRSLAEIWDDLDWPQRQHWIRQLVGHLAPLATRVFPHTGSFINDDFELGPEFEWQDNNTTDVGRAAMEGRTPAGPFSQWNELYLLFVKAAIARVTNRLATETDNTQTEQLQLTAQLLKTFGSHLTHDCFADVPINFCLRDVAPKNLLVDEQAGRITAVLDLEWAGPFWQGEDILEMDYPMTAEDLESRTSNESFTDSSALPYKEQSAFVRSEWRSYGVDPPLLDERREASAIAFDLQYDLFGTEEKQLLDRLQKCLAACHLCQ